MFSNRKTLTVLIVCLSVILALMLGVLLGPMRACWSAETTTEPSTSSTSSTTTQSTTTTSHTTQQTTTSTTTQSTAPPVYKMATATLASVGDFLMHMPVVNTANVVDGEYDFSNVFTYFRDYVSAADYAVGNLETTLAGSAYPYSGYPQFNCPDGIVPSLQAAGFDMLLTANNHTYDTRATGFYRTQEIIRAYEMDYLGTIDAPGAPLWQILDLNGIQIGVICYTYETDDNPDSKALNGIPMNAETAALIGTFSYGQLDTFYGEMAQQIEAMETAGAEAVVLYIHWGDEYQTRQNATQSAMAQRLCDLGVDVIVGGHPHVVQPMQLLTSTVDESHKTVCLYSTGNILSNQRISQMSLKTGHTEDGLLLSVTFAKYSDGTVIVEAVDILPTWVDLHYDPETGKNVYSILPLDTRLPDWLTAFDLNEERYLNACNSYERTMAIVGEGLTAVQEYLAQLVMDTEAALGVTE